MCWTLSLCCDFSCSISINPHNYLRRKGMLLPPSRWANWGSERSRHLPKVTLWVTWQNQDWNKALHRHSMKVSVPDSLFSKETLSYISFFFSSSGLWHTPIAATFLLFFIFTFTPTLVYLETLSYTGIFPGHPPYPSFNTKISSAHIPLVVEIAGSYTSLLMNRTPLQFRAKIVPDKRSHFPVSLAIRVGQDCVQLLRKLWRGLPRLMGRGSGENGHIYMYGQVPSLSTWNYYNIVNWLDPNIK